MLSPQLVMAADEEPVKLAFKPTSAVFNKLSNLVQSSAHVNIKDYPSASKEDEQWFKSYYSITGDEDDDDSSTNPT